VGIKSGLVASFRGPADASYGVIHSPSGLSERVGDKSREALLKANRHRARATLTKLRLPRASFACQALSVDRPSRRSPRRPRPRARRLYVDAGKMPETAEAHVLLEHLGAAGTAESSRKSDPQRADSVRARAARLLTLVSKVGTSALCRGRSDIGDSRTPASGGEGYFALRMERRLWRGLRSFPRWPP
jgi:hypothetical protein